MSCAGVPQIPQDRIRPWGDHVEAMSKKRPRAPKTGFDKDLDERTKDSAFAPEHNRARTDIHQLGAEEAADLLRVSRTYLVRLLREGVITSKTVGKRRVVQAADVLAFKQRRDARRRRGLRELSRMTQRFGGYDAEK
jgi:excisionase family DNA binding protein